MTYLFFVNREKRIIGNGLGILWITRGMYVIIKSRVKCVNKDALYYEYEVKKKGRS